MRQQNGAITGIVTTAVLTASKSASTPIAVPLNKSGSVILVVILHSDNVFTCLPTYQTSLRL